MIWGTGQVILPPDNTFQWWGQEPLPPLKDHRQMYHETMTALESMTRSRNYWRGRARKRSK